MILTLNLKAQLLMIIFIDCGFKIIIIIIIIKCNLMLFERIISTNIFNLSLD